MGSVFRNSANTEQPEKRETKTVSISREAVL